MANYIVRRIVYMFLLLLILSFVSFMIIQLPPGDYLSTMIQNMRNLGMTVDEDMIRSLETRYGLDQPVMLQYLKWLGNLLQGDMGRSFQWNEEVTALIAERLALTVTISFASLIFVYVVAVPIGIYSATHQYSLGDYTFTVLGFIGLATPNFLLALILMYVAFSTLDWSVGGLFSREYVLEPWSIGKVIDLLKHLPIPLLVIGTAGTAAIIRILRGSLLDELAKQYVITARAKGLHEGIILFKYPVRLALNPIISSIGGLLPTIVSGATLTAIVLSLPTIGPLLLRALQAQDMYLAGSMVMLLSALAMIGTLVSDLLLVTIDPRIRFESEARA
jgi:peptide/nickel transport system permease protein